MTRHPFAPVGSRQWVWREMESNQVDGYFNSIRTSNRDWAANLIDALG